MNHKRWSVALGLLLVIPSFFSGCAGEYGDAASKSATLEYESETDGAASEGITATGMNAASNTADVSAATQDRKIIYNSTIGLVVEDYQQFEQQLPILVQNHGGFVANSDTDRRYNDRQSGTWVIRIPVDSYSDFLGGIHSLGFAESRSENAQDVTEEYVDIESRIKNKQKLEERVLTMLDERTGKLSEVLEIERELSRVREEIERMEGRIRYLKNRTRLATVTIRCREQKEYEPAEVPTFATRITRSWSDSIRSLRVTAEHLVVAMTAMIPWLVVLGVPLIVLWKLMMRRWRRRVSRT